MHVIEKLQRISTACTGRTNRSRAIQQQVAMESQDSSNEAVLSIVLIITFASDWTKTMLLQMQVVDTSATGRLAQNALARAHSSALFAATLMDCVKLHLTKIRSKHLLCLTPITDQVEFNRIHRC